GFVSFAASSTQVSSGVAKRISLPVEHSAGTLTKPHRPADNTRNGGLRPGGSWSEWTRPCQQPHTKVALSSRLARFLSLPAHSLCYPSPPTQAASVVAWPAGGLLLGPSLSLYLIDFSPAVNSSPLSPHSELDRLRVVLVSPRNPLNIGAAARAMSNFGYLHLRVLNPYELAFREARSAVGAAPLLARAEEFKTVAEAVADCTLVVGTTSVGLRELQ